MRICQFKWSWKAKMLLLNVLLEAFDSFLDPPGHPLPPPRESPTKKNQMPGTPLPEASFNFR